ncbi:MAG: homocysteine S-methyltransferase family protein [Pseudomonadota bacterium]
MVTILDGGMGQELIKRAGKATDLWSLKALMEAPEMVRDVHAEFFAAGAEIATTNTYCCLPDRLDPKGYGDQLEALTRQACDLACEAREAHGSGLVFGGLGPQGFSYQPHNVPPAPEAAAVYASVAGFMSDLVDGYILETMASVEQVRGGLMGLLGCGKPVWLGLTVDDVDGTKLRSGEDIREVLPLVAEFDPEVVLVNCSPPEAVRSAVPILAQAGLTVGAYANGFVNISEAFNSIHTTVDVLETRKDLSPQAYLAEARHWVADGASVVGGCCEIGPEHIRVLSEGLGDAG